jgi:uncharacterized membrane protein
MGCCASPQIRTAQKEPAAFTRTHLPSFTHVCDALDAHCIPRKRAALVRASSLISLTPVLLLLRYANMSTLMHTEQKSCTCGQTSDCLTHSRVVALVLLLLLLLLRYANMSTLMHTVQKSCTRAQTSDCLTHSRVVALVLLLLLLLLRYANAGRRHNWLTRRLVL